MKSTLSPDARAFLQERRLGVLGTINRDGTPHLSAMWYLLEDDAIVMNTVVGSIKERNMRHNPHISLCIEDEGYITLSGIVEFIDNPETIRADIYRLAVRYEGEEGAQRTIESTSKEHRVSLRLKFDHVIERL
jgi:PPOX class probable F420-dependent enzyme